jgi:hypothetical protein
MATKTKRIVDRLQEDNPQLQVTWGGRHVKLYVRGQLVGILPLQLRTEGLAKNSVTQLRRAGLRVLCPAASRQRWPGS